MAVAVAGGVPCLRRFAPKQSGRVLLFAAEDALHVVRQRLVGIARDRGGPSRVWICGETRLDADLVSGSDLTPCVFKPFCDDGLENDDEMKIQLRHLTVRDLTPQQSSLVVLSSGP